MSLKAMVRLGILIGSTVGGYVPVIWGAEIISFSSLFGSILGGLLGVWIAYKIDQRF
jgi:predicted MFS family arabinose efflux permease